MVGPGVGKNLANFIVHGEPLIEEAVFLSLSYYRDFHGSTEKLK